MVRVSTLPLPTSSMNYIVNNDPQMKTQDTEDGYSVFDKWKTQDTEDGYSVFDKWKKIPN